MIGWGVGFARAEARFGMISRPYLFKGTFGFEMYLTFVSVP
jgi:hypothetical protein